MPPGLEVLARNCRSHELLLFYLQVVKCLLIVPNPESALNEEAGRQLLERYDDYAKYARLMTSIHAASAGQSNFAQPSQDCSTSHVEGPSSEPLHDKEDADGHP